MVRGPSDKDALKLANERLDKMLARIYLLWLLGIGVGLVKLRADKVTFNGIQYSIENPEVIQGLIFVAVILCYVTIVGIGFMFSIQYTTSGSRMIVRRMIHLATGSKATLKLAPREIRTIKRVARHLLALSVSILMTITLLPLLHIALFERTALGLALSTMFKDWL